MAAVSNLLENALRLHRSGDIAAAGLAYREILKRQPNNPDALNLLGVLRQQTGEHLQAVEAFTKAAVVVPRHAPYYVNRGMSLRALGRSDEALADFRKAIELDPKGSEAHHQLGNALKALQRHAEAVQSLQSAAELSPRNAPVWLNLGVALLALSRRDEAITSFQKAVTLEPGRAEARNILGSALLDAGRIDEARSELRKALQLNPRLAAAHDNLGRAYRASGRPAEAVEQFRRALQLQPSPATHSNLVYALNFVPGLDPNELFLEHKRWAPLYAPPQRTTPAAHAPVPVGSRRLRIGYVSPDFVHHAVAYFIEPVLSHHDKSRCEVFCYSNVAVPDNVTARLRTMVDTWRDIASMDDEQVAAAIRADKIDILVDLSGHTAKNRLLVFARKPAPVQVTWLGYPNTTGLEAINFRITDAISDPVGYTEHLYTERLVRLPGPFSCYLPSSEAPAVAAPPSSNNGYVTFGSFNHLAKISETVLGVWAQLLVRMPSAKLLMKARGLADDAIRARVISVFSGAGVAVERLIFSHDELPVAAHLARFNEIDIALDSFPYNGTTTTCEALWMGLPVITLAGTTHVSRVSASLLTHIGRPEWVAGSEAEYIEKAVALASDLPALAEARLAQRKIMRASPLCDARRFTGTLEAAYEQIWHSACRQR